MTCSVACGILQRIYTVYASKSSGTAVDVSYTQYILVGYDGAFAGQGALVSQV